MIPDVHTVSRILREVAAAEVLPRFRTLTAADVQSKSGPHDLVTTADIEAEHALTAKLPQVCPGSVVIGEEATSADPKRLGLLAEDAPVWVVDPVDGTANFARGDPFFAMIVALCHRGDTVAGWILDPVGDVMIWATVGEGTWTDEGGGGRLRLNPPRTIAEMRGALGYGPAKRFRRRIEAGLAEKPRDLVSLGSVGRGYMDLARSRLHFSRFKGLKPWDHAAGLLIHTEAGGISALAEDAKPYRPAPRMMPETVISAPDRDTWFALRTALDDVPESANI